MPNFHNMGSLLRSINYMEMSILIFDSSKESVGIFDTPINSVFGSAGCEQTQAGLVHEFPWNALMVISGIFIIIFPSWLDSVGSGHCFTLVCPRW